MCWTRSEPGVDASYKRNPDWWGKDLPFNKGQWNFRRDPLRLLFTDARRIRGVQGRRDCRPIAKATPPNGCRPTTSPPSPPGTVIKAEIPHSRPSGIEGLVFNTRRPIFADWRVREALILAFNFEFINQQLNGGLLPRIPSYFGNSAWR
jgi:peptide/nickel transport system substrate-binding protein